MEMQKRTKFITDIRRENSEKAARIFNIYPHEKMTWNYSTEDDTTDTIMSADDQELLASMEG
jgi:hypothetical protein